MGCAVFIIATEHNLKLHTCMPVLTLFKYLKHLHTFVVQIQDIKECNTHVQCEEL